MAETGVISLKTASAPEELTMDEIRHRFESEWVLLENPETTPALEVVRGRLLFHSRDRDELYRRALELRPKSSAILFIGHPANDVAFAL